MQSTGALAAAGAFHIPLGSLPPETVAALEEVPEGETLVESGVTAYLVDYNQTPVSDLATIPLVMSQHSAVRSGSFHFFPVAGQRVALVCGVVVPEVNYSEFFLPSYMFRNKSFQARVRIPDRHFYEEGTIHGRV